MKLGILVLSVNDKVNENTYNLQEIGLARALDKLCSKVKVYRLVSKKREQKELKIEDTSNATITYLPSKKLGNNGCPDLRYIDKDIDALICFSDTQIFLPRVYRWTRKNSIILLPYIGVIESHSNSGIISAVINYMSRRNINIYRKEFCLAKNPDVEEKLKNKGVKNVRLCPIGLDMYKLEVNYTQYNRDQIREQYGYSETDKVLLFVGRLEAEKNPLEMIELFIKLYHVDKNYRLSIVGDGYLKKELLEKIENEKIDGVVNIIDSIPNSDIWKMYIVSDVFINLNRKEIFGMAILEAMYYECQVVAWKAPGPEYILDFGKYGNIVTSNEEAISSIMQGNIDLEEAHNHIMNDLLWDTSAKIILDCVKA